MTPSTLRRCGADGAAAVRVHGASVSSEGGWPFIAAASRFGAAQRPQEIAAGELGEVGVAPAAADQLGEQQGVAVDAFEAGTV